MRQATKEVLCYVAVAIVTAAALVGCSLAQEEDAAKSGQAPPAATQIAEKIQKAADPIVASVGNAAGGVAQVAKEAEGLGIPGAGAVAGVASIISALAAGYAQRRRGNRVATQLVDSVDAAFLGQITDAHTDAMKQRQDADVQELVKRIKKSRPRRAAMR